VPRRILLTLVLALTSVAAGPAATADTPTATVAARAVAVRIVLPGGRVVGTPAVTGSPAGSAASYSYPADGSVIVTGASHATASTTAGRTGRAGASAAAANISIFDGEITADSATASASAAAGLSTAGGGFAGTGVVGLQALGRPHAFGRAELQGWGYLTIATHSVDRTADPGTKAYDGIAAALDIRLIAPHAGLPAGAEIEVGYVQASAETAPKPAPETGPLPGDRPQLLPPATEPLIGVPQVIAPPLTGGPYVFPVFGGSRLGDAYGDSNNGTSWQHGVDILGSLGQPLVAVADGTLFALGWNQAGGNRLWLRDRAGNTFYYAHLSAFSTLARKGAHVQAGQVIGFMGDTGNAGGLPTHLHFEVHPVSMLFLGNDGAVDPGAYLPSWRRLTSLSFPVAAGWAPTVPGTIKAPEPGAFLLGGSDISTADGLAPASLRRVVKPSGRK
jgi:murein DD-endopeptidase MepM/ murein hydrolase activator NlpD